MNLCQGATSTRVLPEALHQRDTREHLLQIRRVLLTVLRVVQQRVDVVEDILLRDALVTIGATVCYQGSVGNVLLAGVAVHDLAAAQVEVESSVILNDRLIGVEAKGLGIPHEVQVR